MLSYMHQGEPIGHLTHRDGRPIGVEQLARMVGESVEEVKRLLVELEEAVVPGKAENGAYTCRRMIREEEKYQRYLAGQAEAGKRGAASRWGAPSEPHHFQKGGNGEPHPDPIKKTWGQDGFPFPSPFPSPSPPPSQEETAPAAQSAPSTDEKTRRALLAREPSDDGNYAVISKLARDLLQRETFETREDLVERVKDAAAQAHIAYSSTVTRNAVESEWVKHHSGLKRAE